jgi:hypothetical protein
VSQLLVGEFPFPEHASNGARPSRRMTLLEKLQLVGLFAATLMVSGAAAIIMLPVNKLSASSGPTPRRNPTGDSRRSTSDWA